MRRIVFFVLVAASIAGHGVAFAKPPTAKPPKADTPRSSAPNTHADTAAKPAGVVKHLESNPALVARLQPLLPPSTTLEQAALGFRNQGQFIAALHVSRNLNIPFADLKAAVTGDHAVSLGRAIQHLKPAADARAETRKAENQAKSDERANDARQ